MIVDFIENSIAALPDAIGIVFVRQLFHAKRPRILGKIEEALQDSLPIFALADVV